MRVNHVCTTYGFLKHFDTKFIYLSIYLFICDAYILICVPSNANFNVPYLSLCKCFSLEILRVA